MATIFLAESELTPCLSLIFWRTEEFGGGLELLVFEVLERDAALDQLCERISVTAFSEYSLALASWMVSSPSSSIVDLESLRSKRAWTSFDA